MYPCMMVGRVERVNGVEPSRRVRHIENNHYQQGFRGEKLVGDSGYASVHQFKLSPVMEAHRVRPLGRGHYGHRCRPKYPTSGATGRPTRYPRAEVGFKVRDHLPLSGPGHVLT